MDDKIYTFLLFDQIEYRQTGDANPVGWEMLGWIGGDYNRFWIKSEGEQATVGSGGDAEVQLPARSLSIPRERRGDGAASFAPAGHRSRDFDDPKHAGLHVIKNVAVKRPFALSVCGY